MGANWRCCCEMEFDEKGSLELHQKEECTQAQIYMEREALIVERDKFLAEVVELKRKHHRLKDGFDANMKHLVQRTRERDSALLQIRAFEEAKVKDLGELFEMIEVLGPFYLHAKALRDAGRLTQLGVISQEGVSALCGGAFEGVIEIYEKYEQARKHNTDDLPTLQDILKTNVANLEKQLTDLESKRAKIFQDDVNLAKSVIALTRAERQISALRRGLGGIVLMTDCMKASDAAEKILNDTAEEQGMRESNERCACDDQGLCQVHAAFKYTVEGRNPNEKRKPVRILCSGCGSQQKDCKCT